MAVVCYNIRIMSTEKTGAGAPPKKPLSTDPYKGVRDFYPEDWAKLDYAFSILRQVLRRREAALEWQPREHLRVRRRVRKGDGCVPSPAYDLFALGHQRTESFGFNVD
mgnify:CR=1 FL=1